MTVHIGAEDAGTQPLELPHYGRTRVTVVVARADFDHGDGGPNSGEEGRFGESRAMMWDLKNLRAEAPPAPQKRLLRLVLDITGEQHGYAADHCTDH